MLPYLTFPESLYCFSLFSVSFSLTHLPQSSNFPLFLSLKKTLDKLLGPVAWWGPTRNCVEHCINPCIVLPMLCPLSLLQASLIPSSILASFSLTNIISYIYYLVISSILHHSVQWRPKPVYIIYIVHPSSILSLWWLWGALGCVYICVELSQGHRVIFDTRWDWKPNLPDSRLKL